MPGAETWSRRQRPAANDEEGEGMDRQSGGALRVYLDFIVRTMGLEWVIEQLGVRRIIEHLGVKRILKELGGLKQLVAELSPEQRRELKQLLQERIPGAETWSRRKRPAANGRRRGTLQGR